MKIETMTTPDNYTPPKLTNNHCYSCDASANACRCEHVTHHDRPCICERCAVIFAEVAKMLRDQSAREVLTTSDIVAASCPNCRAKPGERCIGRLGQRLRLERLHMHVERALKAGDGQLTWKPQPIGHPGHACVGCPHPKPMPVGHACVGCPHYY